MVICFTEKGIYQWNAPFVYNKTFFCEGTGVPKSRNSWPPLNNSTNESNLKKLHIFNKNSDQT
jgi:hypothetical protein